MRRLLLMIGVFLALAPSAQAKLFAPKSVWNARVADHPGLDPNSAAISRTLLADDPDPYGLGRHRCLLHPDLHGGAQPTPGPGATDLVAFRDLDGAPAAPGNPDSALRPASDRFRCPPDRLAALQGPAVGPMGKPEKAGGKWTAQTGDAFKHVSESPGFSSTESWPPFTDQTWTSTATSLPVSAGTMTVNQIRRGRIGHALALDIPGARAGEYSWPAQQTDGYDSSAASIPEGAHFVLKRGYNCNKLRLRIAHTICWAAKYRGLIVRDQAPGVGLYAEDPARFGAGEGPLLRWQQALRWAIPQSLSGARPVSLGTDEAAQDASLQQPVGAL